MRKTFTCRCLKNSISPLHPLPHSPRGAKAYRHPLHRLDPMLTYNVQVQLMYLWVSDLMK